MISKDTFTVEIFKELTVHKIQSSLDHRHDTSTNTTSDFLSWNIINIVKKSVKFNLRNIELIFPPKGIECKILKLGNFEWQTGKVRIHVMVTQSSHNRVSSSEVKVIKLEFCYDKPPQTESPLDNIQQTEDYQQLLNHE